MKLKSIYLPPNGMIIGIDEYDGKDYIGKIYHHFSESSIDFSGVNQMLFKMEEFYNWYGFPQPSMASRSFAAKEESPVFNKAKREEGIMQEDDKLLEKSGEKATFVVHVKYRQNATWQGSVVWAEQQKSCNFRSALELLKLIDSALEKGESQEVSQEE